ncbi:histidine kinase, partial [Streptococcus suis]
IEFNLEEALIRRPQVILVDELAHTNCHGSRNKKRFQDIEELLKAGIDVFTTINIQHLEGLNDVIEKITGIIVNEKIPDYIFEEADQIELIDI